LRLAFLRRSTRVIFSGRSAGASDPPPRELRGIENTSKTDL
jgi:hypothetical protein